LALTFARFPKTIFDDRVTQINGVHRGFLWVAA
jgi:hypothetical protein